MGRTIVLVSCVKRKKANPAKAKDVYDSTLFRSQRAFAECMSDDWYILSAKFGLLHPETEIGPYEQTLKNARSHEKREWSERVYAEFEKRTNPEDFVIITAGEDYCRFLVPMIAQRGHRIERPVKGLRMGFIPGRLNSLVAQAKA
jgi:hypothetical protein